MGTRRPPLLGLPVLLVLGGLLCLCLAAPGPRGGGPRLWRPSAAEGLRAAGVLGWLGQRGRAGPSGAVFHSVGLGQRAFWGGRGTGGGSASRQRCCQGWKGARCDAAVKTPRRTSYGSGCSPLRYPPGPRGTPIPRGACGSPRGGSLAPRRHGVAQEGGSPRTPPSDAVPVQVFRRIGLIICDTLQRTGGWAQRVDWTDLDNSFFCGGVWANKILKMARHLSDGLRKRRRVNRNKFGSEGSQE